MLASGLSCRPAGRTDALDAFLHNGARPPHPFFVPLEWAPGVYPFLLFSWVLWVLAAAAPALAILSLLGEAFFSAPWPWGPVLSEHYGQYIAYNNLAG